MERNVRAVRAVRARPIQKKENLLLEMNDLRVSYGEREALHGYSLELKPGEIHVIAGESGSGVGVVKNS